MLDPSRARAFHAFVERYEFVREAEGRRLQDPKVLKALPYLGGSGARRREWAIRAKSFRTLIRDVVAPFERAARRSLRVLDLGSGVGWLAYRLARRGHDVAAVDLLVNDFDGLGVHRHYDGAFLSVEAEFDRLPFGDAAFDVVVYNASFHYASDYAATLEESLRVLSPGGRIVVMDTPLYREASSGEAMVREREESFAARYGIEKHAVWTEGFLTYDRLEALGRSFSIRWELVEPWYGLRWWIKPWWAGLRGSREPARFKLMIGCRVVRRNT
jgi:SAM-dependent methyltransferase